MSAYRRDIERAWGRVRSVPSTVIGTRGGMVEYAENGSGLPVLLCHGILGSHVEGIGMVRTYVGDGVRCIAPSRMGYFGSSLDDGDSVATQADRFADLLDALAVDRALVVGYSAGGPSAISFALRHPHRVVALILAASALPGAKRFPDALRPFMRAIFASDRLFWVLNRVAPKLSTRMFGVPKGYRPTPEEAMTIRSVGESVFPHAPRAEGATFDMFIGNPSPDAMPLEEVQAPTLFVHAADDSFAPYENAVRAARRVPGARLVTIDHGGHLFLGAEDHVRSEIAAFLSEHAAGRVNVSVGTEEA